MSEMKKLDISLFSRYICAQSLLRKFFLCNVDNKNNNYIYEAGSVKVGAISRLQLYFFW